MSLSKSLSTNSTQSFDSFASDDESAESTPKTYDMAPWDIFTEHPMVGKVCVATKGEVVPKETRYLAKKGVDIGVKFSVDEYLAVTVIKTKKAPTRMIDENSLNESIFSASSPSNTPVQSSYDNSTKVTTTPDSTKKAKGDWLSNLDRQFKEIVIGGLEAAVRDKVLKSIASGAQLGFKENQAIIHSVCYHMYGYIGSQRPDPSLCRDVAHIIKKQLPETFAYEEKIVTEEFGVLPTKKGKGEGGVKNLASRISEAFYNSHMRSGIKRPEASTSEEDMMILSKKKVRKYYGIVPEKWMLASKISKEAFEESKKNFEKLEDITVAEVEDLSNILDGSREYLQAMFREEDPSSHLLILKAFWVMPRGLKMLSLQFEWLVDGSRDGDLMASIEGRIANVMSLVEKYLVKKGGAGWEEKFKKVAAECQVSHGNDTMKTVFLIRELGRTWSNKSEKLLFVEGEDSNEEISDQPFLHLVKLGQMGVGDYPEQISISVRVGNTVMFEDVTLTQGLSAVIQLCFTFNLLFPFQADDLFNFCQRMLASFGPTDGARNKLGQVKKKFIDFQCFVGSVMLQEEKGVKKRLFK